MHTILVMVTSIGLVVGGLAAAAALCWLLWQVFTPLRHPEWAPSVILVLAALAVTGDLPDSQFLHLALAYAVAAAIPLWIEGLAWRRHHFFGRMTGPDISRWR